MDTASAFHVRLATFKFIDIVERSVEARHSVIHRFSTFRPSKLCSLSNKLRVPEFEHLLRLRPEMLSELVECTRRARKPKALAEELDIIRHPLLQGLLNRDAGRGAQSRNRRYLWTRCVREVIYRCDLDTENQDCSAARQVDTQHKNRVERQKDTLQARNLTFQLLMNKLFWAHFAKDEPGPSDWGNDYRCI